MVETIKGLNWKDIAVRSAKTFLAAALAGWSLTGYSFEKGAIVGAVSAGLTALINFALEIWKQK